MIRDYVTELLSQPTLWYPTTGLLNYDHKTLYFPAITGASLTYN